MSDRPKQNNDHSWPTYNGELNASADLYIFFHGLFAFGYNRETNVCEVGTHSKAEDHEFALFIVEFDGRQGNLLYSFTPDSPSDVTTPIVIRVKNSTQDGVSFYESGNDGHSDWSRLPDLESDFFHGVKVKKLKKAMKPRLFIHNGVFFTALTTAPYTFDCFNEDTKEREKHLGPIAYVPAVEVSHGDGGYLSLTFEHHEIRLTGAESKKYLVWFVNVCPDCDFDPDSLDMKKRNDFYLNYKFFKKPDGHPQYGLMLSKERKEEEKSERTEFFNYLVERIKDWTSRSSKDAPCGGVGFGKSVGLDET